MYTIGRLAKQAGVSNDTIRFYERQGLLRCSQRTDSGYQLFDEDALKRLAFVRNAQRCGFSLADIRVLLDVCDGANSPELNQFLADKRAQIEETIGALREMSMELSELCRGREQRRSR